MIEHLFIDLLGDLLPFLGGRFVHHKWQCLTIGGRGISEGTGMEMGSAFGGVWSFELEVHANF